ATSCCGSWRATTPTCSGCSTRSSTTGTSPAPTPSSRWPSGSRTGPGRSWQRPSSGAAATRARCGKPARLVGPHWKSCPAPGRACTPGMGLGDHGGDMTTTRERSDRLVELVDTAWQRGWRPIELHGYIERHCRTLTTKVLDDTIAANLARYAAPTIHEAWHDHL